MTDEAREGVVASDQSREGGAIYYLFGWWYRWQACKMAATLMAGRNERTEEGITPTLWSVTVFFEKYMADGAGGTAEDFGPKEPVELKTATSSRL